MSADFWIYDPKRPEAGELTVATCATCSMVMDTHPRDSFTPTLSFTFARLKGISDYGLRSHHWNVTYNLSDMLQEAGFMGWSAFASDEAMHDSTQAAAHMAGVLANLTRDPVKFRKMNPPNGWGNYFGLVAELCDFVKVAGTHPYYRVDSWL